jgi:hypothetical protein
VVEFISNCTKKSTGAETSETRFYVSNLPDDTPWIGMAIRKHWAIESMHWGLDFNLLQDSIKRKTTKAARNLGKTYEACFKKLYQSATLFISKITKINLSRQR